MIRYLKKGGDMTTKNLFIQASLILIVAIFVYTPAGAGGNPADGEQAFESICSSCHGAIGITEIPGVPVFSNGERMDKTDEQLKHSIRNGVNNPDNPAGMVMPPFGGGPVLNEKQLSDVIAYIRSLKKN